VLGVDIGNSFTTAATAQLDDVEERLLASHPVTLGTLSNSAPAVAFVAEDGHLIIGEDAERNSAENPERVIREFRQRVGDPVAITVGEFQFTAEDVYAAVARWVIERTEEL